MGRFLYGALIGGAAMYLLDPESGAERRQRLAGWWRRNRGPMMEVGQATSQRIDDLKPAAEQAASSAAETAQRATSKVRGRGASGWQPPEPVKRRASGSGL